MGQGAILVGVSSSGHPFSWAQSHFDLLNLRRSISSIPGNEDVASCLFSFASEQPKNWMGTLKTCKKHQTSSNIHGFDMVSTWNILDKTETYSKLVYAL